MKKLLAVLCGCLIVFGIAGCSTQVEYEFYKGSSYTIPFNAITVSTDYQIISDYSEIAVVSSNPYTPDFFYGHTLIVIKHYCSERLEECNINSVTKKGHKIIISMEVGYKCEISSGLYAWENYVYVEVETKNIKEVEVKYTEIVE